MSRPTLEAQLKALDPGTKVFLEPLVGGGWMATLHIPTTPEVLLYQGQRLETGFWVHREVDGEGSRITHAIRDAIRNAHALEVSDELGADSRIGPHDPEHSQDDAGAG